MGCSSITQPSEPGFYENAAIITPVTIPTETLDEVRDRILEAAAYIHVERLGTTDDCGFAPFADDTSNTRDKAFAKIQARAEGTARASRALGNGR